MEQPTLIYYIVPRQSGVTAFAHSVSQDIYPVVENDPRVGKSLFINTTQRPKLPRAVITTSEFDYLQQTINTGIHNIVNKNFSIKGIPNEIKQELKKFMLSGQPIIVESTAAGLEDIKTKTISVIKHIRTEHRLLCELRDMEYDPIPVHWFETIDMRTDIPGWVVTSNYINRITIMDSNLRYKVLPIMRGIYNLNDGMEVLDMCKSLHPNNHLEVYHLVKGLYELFHNTPLIGLTSENYPYEVHDLTSTLSMHKVRLSEFVRNTETTQLPEYAQRLHKLLR